MYQRLPEIRRLNTLWWRRVAVTAGCLVLWRLLAVIPLPIVGAGLVHPDLRQPPLPGAFAMLAGQSVEHFSVVAMGLEPFLEAFVIFWLWGIVSEEVGKARHDPEKAWPYLAWLTLGMASLRAFGLTNLLLQGHRAALTSGPGLSTICALILGSMALLGLGRVVHRFGVPAAYGVWFLFGVGSLIKGTHSLVFFLGADKGDSLLPAIVTAYALISVLILASTVLVFDGIRSITLRRRGSHGTAARETHWPLHILIGGFTVPVVIASVIVTWPPIIIQLLTGRPAEQAALYWSPTSSYLLVDVAYSAVFCLLVIGACFFTMFVNQNSTAAAEILSADGYVIPGVPAGTSTARYLTRAATSVTALGGLWMAVVVVICPVAFEAFLGSSRPRLPLGGGPFVITAAILIDAVKRVRQNE